MEDKENRYDEGLYKACVHAFFLAYHQIGAYCCWLLFRLTDLKRYCKFEVSLEQVMFPCAFVDIFCSNGQKNYLWYAHQAIVNKHWVSC
jgi:hypothetical protein